MISARAHARILRTVAGRALDDARDAWKEARASPTEDTVRSAFRACVFAARALRRVAEVTSGEAVATLAAAERVDAAASTLRDQLVEVWAGPRPC